MLNGRFKILLRKHQNTYSNPDTGLTYNVIVQCDPITCWSQYVPGDVDQTWYDYTDFIEDSEKLSFTWDKVNSGNSTNSQTSQDGSNYDKGITSELLFFDDAYKFIYDWLLTTECQILNCVEVKIVDLIAENTYRIFEIKNDNIELAPVDEPCQMHIKLREQDTTWQCVFKTTIWDNWQHWFENSTIKEHPCFLTCIEPRPRLINSVRMALTLLFYSNPNVDLITWITGSDAFMENARKVLNANKFVDSPLIRTYIENVAGKCGLKMDTIFDEGQHWQNLCLYYPQAGYMWESNDDAKISPSLAYHDQNRWLITIADLFDKLKLVFAAEWYVTPNNTIVFKFTKDLIDLAPIYDFTAEGAEVVYGLIYSFNGDKKPAYGDYEYQTDGSDLASQEMITLYNDIIDFDGPAFNPMLEGNITKNFEFAPTAFIRDGRAPDYMRELINDGETGAYIVIGILVVVVAALFLGVTTLIAAGVLIGFLALWAINPIPGLGVANKAEELRAEFVDNPIYSGAVRITFEQVMTPRLILWDGVSKNRAKAVATAALPTPNLYYNTSGTAYNVLNSIGQDNPTNTVYNYPLYFDGNFTGNLFDQYHDEIDNPLKSKESHQDARFYVDLCTDMLNLFGVFETQYAVIGKVVLLERRDNYDIYVRIGNINVDYDSERINIKGTVLRHGCAGTQVQGGNISNISARTALLGFNGQVNNSISYNNAAFRAAIKDTGATMIREPGGTIANSAEWETAIPSVSETKALYDTTSSNFSFVLNMITRDLTNQMDWLAALFAQGIPITHVEMGNEFPNTAEWLATFSTKENYSSICATWITAIKAVYPACKFGIPGGNRSGLSVGWNAAMLADNPDAYLVWHYHNREQYAPGGYVDTNKISSLIDADYATAFAGIPKSKLWVTEYNLKVKTGGGNEEPVTFANDYEHGLAASYMMQKFYEIGCSVVLFHNIVSAEGNGAIIATNSGSYLSPTGVAIKNYISTV